MQTWEYCALRGAPHQGPARGPAGGNPAIWNFTPNGIQVSEIQGGNEQNETAKAIARLGAEGWEIVGVVMLPSNAPLLYFKRPKS
jgi:hypothetical protein